MKRNWKRIMSLLLIAAMLLTTDMRAAAAELTADAASGNAALESAVSDDAVSEDMGAEIAATEAAASENDIVSENNSGIRDEAVSADAADTAAVEETGSAQNVTDKQVVDGLTVTIYGDAKATYDGSTMKMSSGEVRLWAGETVSQDITLDIAGDAIVYLGNVKGDTGSKFKIKGTGILAFDEYSIYAQGFKFEAGPMIVYKYWHRMVISQNGKYHVLEEDQSISADKGTASIACLGKTISDNKAKELMEFDYENYKIKLKDKSDSYISGNAAGGYSLVDAARPIVVNSDPNAQEIIIRHEDGSYVHYSLESRAICHDIGSYSMIGTRKSAHSLDFSDVSSLSSDLNPGYRFALSTNDTATASELQWTKGSDTLKFTGLQPDTGYYLYVQGIYYFYSGIHHTDLNIWTKSLNDAAVSCNYTYVLEYGGKSRTITKSASVSDDAITIYPSNDISTDLNGMITSSADQVTGFRFCKSTAVPLYGSVKNDGGYNGARTYMNYRDGASVTFDTDSNTDIHIVPVVSGHVSDGVTIDTVAPVEYDGNRHVASDEKGGKGITKDITVILKNNGNTLTYGTDYTVTYKNNVNASVKFVLDAAGNTTTEKLNPDDSRKWPMVTVTGKGNYSGLKMSAYFDIYPKKFDTETALLNKIDGVNIYETKNGQAITGLKPYYTADSRGKVNYSYKVTFESRTLIKQRDYEEQLYKLVSGNNGYSWQKTDASGMGDVTEPTLYMVSINGTGNYYGNFNVAEPNAIGIFGDSETALGMFLVGSSRVKDLSDIKFTYNKSINWKENITYSDFNISSNNSTILKDCIYSYGAIKYLSGRTRYIIIISPSVDWEIRNKRFGHCALYADVVTKTLRKSDFHLDWNSIPYDGKAHAQTVTYTGSGTYNVSYYNADKNTLFRSSFNNSTPGNYYASVEGTGEYAGSQIKLPFSIRGMSLSQAVKNGYVSISAQDAPLNINGTITTLTLTDKLAGQTYNINRYSDNFVVTGWGSNKKAGKTKITVKAAKGMMFTGSATADFVIRQVTVTSIRKYDASKYDSNLTANAIYADVSDVKAVKGKTVTPKVTLYQAQYKFDVNERKYIFFKTPLRQGRDYKVEVTTNNAAGNTVTIKNGTAGNFDFGSGVETLKFGVYENTARNIQVTLSGDGFDTAKNQAVITGSRIEPEVTVSVNGEPVASDGYSVYYKNNVDVGTAKAVVVLKHSTSAADYKYGGKKTVTFRIVRQKGKSLILSIH